MAEAIHRESIRLRLVIRVCALLAAAAGVAALLGWSLGIPILTRLGSGLIPMAPSTALLFLLFGIAAFLRAHLPMHRGAHRGAMALSVAGLLAAAPLLVLSYVGIHPAAEHLVFTITGSVGQAPVGHMSPVTALCFLLAGASFLALPPIVPDGPARTRVAWWLASLLVGTSFVLLLAYVFGAPLFYGGSFIPPAATTSGAFLALGIALLGLAALHARFLLRHDDPAPRTGYVLILVFALLAAGVVTVGYLYQQNYERGYRNHVEEELSAIAELKVRELVRYRRERLGDAATFFGNPSFSSIVRRFLERPADVGARRQVQAWLGRYGVQEESDRAYLLNARGVLRLSVPDTPDPPDSSVARRAPEVIRSGEVVFQDFYRDEGDRKIHLALLIPVFDGGKGGEGLGVVVLRVDPEKDLYPLIRYWPTPSRTAETLLVRREEDDVLFLNPLRFREDAALTLRFPLDPASDMPAVKAVHGTQGIVYGQDYRWERVLADVRRVPDSPWFVVARMDLSEVNEPARERLWWTVSLVCILLLASGAGVGLAWRRERAAFYEERYEAERERAWLQDVIARSLDEIYVVDPRTLRFKFANLGGLRNQGYTMEELSGLTAVDIAPRYAEAEFRDLVRPLITGERPVLVVETVHRRKDGSEYPVEAHLQIVQAAAGDVLLAIVDDITERRQAEEKRRALERQLQTAQRMEAVGTLAGGIAHDFNNALTGIFGFGEMLRSQLAGDERALSNLHEVLRCAERASTLTRQLLTYARRQIIEPVNLSLNQVISDVMKLVSKVVGEGIEIRTYLAKELPTVRADIGQMEQVVVNLVVNARDAMAGGGQLLIETERVHLEEDYVRYHPYMKTGSYVVLTVSDTGVGMDEKTRERVFEPFFTTKASEKGTGLGLAMVYGIVKQHNGFIHLYSEPGKGTAVKIYLPPVDAVPDKVAPEVRLEIRGGTETVLLAEDDEPVRTLVERTLTDLGYTVLVARNGEEAVAEFLGNRDRIDLAILDLVMPRKGGKEAYEEMHRAKPDLKVIFMSGYTANVVHESFVLIAGIPFLPKPFGPGVLARKVREVLDKP